MLFKNLFVFSFVLSTYNIIASSLSARFAITSKAKAIG